MTDDLLQRIQQMQFNDRGAAEVLLLAFVRETFPQLDIVSVELRPLAVSLNSFNGFLNLADDTRLFFKTHTEPDNVIGEYYRAGILADVGYAVIQPKYRSTEAGKHLLIYEVIEDPSVFDVAWEIENGRSYTLVGLTRAQNKADDDLWALYQQTLEPQSGQDAAEAPVHQLFHFRLAQGRMERFYGLTPDGGVSREVTIRLPGIDDPVPVETLRHIRWVINGQHYNDTLADVIGRALYILKPERAGASIVGHGDAHNGNVFWLQSQNPLDILYFDPAFAGRHHPLLDLTKPIFHNVFAMWMYYPDQKRDETKISLQSDGDTWTVEHNYTLPAVREMFLRSKVERVLVPTLRLLKDRGLLDADWRAYLKASLFCCPFLTMNLADQDKFPPGITLLGLCMALEMGAESAGKLSLIDATLDEAESQL
jgi:hypothetical protein